MITNMLLVASGGALGALMRFLLGIGVSCVLPAQFPYGILIANVLGSFLIGFIATILAHIPNQREWLQAFLIFGFLGGFTTFSSFSLDTVTLLVAKQALKAWLNIGMSIVFCLFSCYVGIQFAHQWIQH